MAGRWASGQDIPAGEGIGPRSPVCLGTGFLLAGSFRWPADSRLLAVIDGWLSWLAGRRCWPAVNAGWPWTLVGRDCWLAVNAGWPSWLAVDAGRPRLLAGRATVA